MQKTEEECAPSVAAKAEVVQKEKVAVDEAEHDFDLDIDMETTPGTDLGENLAAPSTSEVLPETKAATETVESDAESLDFEE